MPCRVAFSITTGGAIGGGIMTYYEILLVLALKTISKGNVKASAYGANVILDKGFV